MALRALVARGSALGGPWRMTRERFQAVRALFDEAAELPPEARDAFLRRRCGDDDALRQQVERLLRLDGQAQRREQPPAEAAIGEALRLAMESVPPALARVGPFQLLRVIGQGGMGTVYLGVQESPRRRVAVKILRADHATPEALRRFRHEADVLARLRHPGIASVYEAGIAETPLGPRPYIAMELIEGVPLHRHAEARGLPLRERIELLARVCDAVEHAHAQGIVHRDLKPSNILVGPDGAPHVVDFGVARVIGGGAVPDGAEGGASGADVSMHTRAGQVIGTLAYMSPEQLEGGSVDVLPSADVYALGVVLFESLSGRLPIDVRGVSMAEALRRLREQDPSRLSASQSTLRGDLETIVLKALEKEPQRRYATAGDLGAELRRYLRNEPIEGRPASRLYRIRKFVRRHRGLTVASATIFLLLVTALAVVTLLAVGERQQRMLAEERQRRVLAASYRNAISVARQALAMGDAATACRALEGAPAGSRRWEWDYLRAHVDTSRASLAFHGAPVCAAGVAPDGAVLSVAADGSMVEWREGDTEPRWLAFALPPSGPGGAGAKSATAAVGAARRALLVRGADGRASLWIAGESAPRWQADGVAPVHRQAFTAGADRVVIVRAGAAEVRDVPGGEVRARIPLPVESVAAASLHQGSGTVLVLAGRFVVAIDARSGAELWRSECDEFVVEEGETPCVWLFSAWSRAAQVHDLRSGALLGSLDAATGLVPHAASGRVATLGESGAVQLRTRRGGARVAGLVGATSPVTALAFSDSGEIVVGGDWDGCVRIWSAEPVPAATRVEPSNDATFSAWFSADGRTALTTGWGSVKGWRLTDGAEEWTRFPLDGEIRGLAHHSTSGRLVVSGSDGRVAVLDDARAEVLALSAPAGAAINSVAWLDSESAILAGTADGRILTFDAATLALRDALAISAEPIDVLVVAPGDAAVAAAGRGGSLWLANLRGAPAASTGPGAASGAADPGADTAAFRLDAGILQDPARPRAVALAYSADGGTLAVGLVSGAVETWDVASRTQRGVTLRAARAEARALAFTPDGSRLAIGFSDPVIRVVDAGTLDEMLELPTGASGPVALSFTQEGRTLAAALAAPDGGILLFTGDRAVESAERRFMRGVRQLVRERFESLHFSEDVVASLAANAAGAQGLPDEVRAAAVKEARARGDHPSFLNAQAWAVVRQPARSAAEVELALRRAAMADRMRPGRHPILNTLGFAQWRAGKLDDAERTLSRAMELHAAERGDGHPMNLAARAAVRHAAGRTREAAEDLAAATALMREPGYANDEECRLLLAEVTALMAADAPDSAAGAARSAGPDAPGATSAGP